MTLPELLSQNVSEIFEANGAGIEEELRTAEDGKLSISVPVKLTLVGARVYIVVGLSYARQFKDKLEANMELADPNQPELIERDDDDPPHIHCGPVEITVNKPSKTKRSA